MLISRLYTRYRTSKFIKASSWYLLFSMIQRGLSVFALFLFTHLMSPDDFGAVAIYISWWTVFTAVVTLNVKASINRARIEFADEEFKRFVSSALTISMGTGVIILTVIWLAPSELVQSVFGLQQFYIVLAMINALATTAIEVQLQAWIAGFRYQAHSIISLIWTMLQIGLSILLIIVPWLTPAVGRMVGLTLASSLLGIYFFAAQMMSGREFFNGAHWRYVIAFSVPLIPHVLSGIVLAQFDRILIDRYVGRTEAGLYSFAYQLGQLVYMLLLATNSAWQPWFYEQIKQGNYALIRQKANQYLLVFAGITILAILFVPLVVRFAPQDYWSNIPIIPIIMSSQFFTLLFGFYVYIELYEKKTLYISIGTGLAAAVNIGANVILLPLYGYTVAAWTTLLAYVLLFLFHAAIVKFRLRVPDMLDFRVMLGMAALTTMLAVGYFAILNR